MRTLKTLASALLLVVPLAACSGGDSTDPGGGGSGGGKADANDIALALGRVTADGELSAADVDELFGAAGEVVSRGEMLAIRNATESSAFDVKDEALSRALELAYLANLFDTEIDHLGDPGNGTYAGTEIPTAVRELLARARLSAAVSFDIRDQDADGEGRWTPYPSTSPPIDNMAFDYTEITPAVLAADKADRQVTYNAIVGEANGEPTYEQRTGGTGNIAAHFDELGFHPDLFARGGSNQKWASNCAFLSDGSIHCLPAARRSVLQDLILTNPHLSRCNDEPGFADACHTVMYLGHIDASGGVITGVEISGRLTTRIAKGQANLIDPIALIDAWGFERSPSLRVRFGNTEDGVPATDKEHGVLTAP